MSHRAPFGVQAVALLCACAISSCSTDGNNSGEATDLWVLYVEMRGDTETHLMIDADSSYAIIRFPATRDITGKLGNSQFESLKALLTDDLFRTYAATSLPGATEDPGACRSSAVGEPVAMLQWEHTRIGGMGGFGCWRPPVAQMDTQHLLDVFSECTSGLISSAE